MRRKIKANLAGRWTVAVSQRFRYKPYRACSVATLVSAAVTGRIEIRQEAA